MSFLLTILLALSSLTLYYKGEISKHKLSLSDKDGYISSLTVKLSKCEDSREIEDSISSVINSESGKAISLYLDSVNKIKVVESKEKRIDVIKDDKDDEKGNTTNTTLINTRRVLDEAFNTLYGE